MTINQTRISRFFNHLIEGWGLVIFTYEVAYGAFDEKERESLEQGKIADMVIFNKNPLELAPSSRKYKPGMGFVGMLLKGLTAGKVKI